MLFVDAVTDPAGVEKSLREYWRERGLDISPKATADPELLEYVETLLVGSVGATCARLVVASVVDEEQLEPDQLIAIVDEASQLAALEERHRLARELHDSVSQAAEGLRLLRAITSELGIPAVAMSIRGGVRGQALAAGAYQFLEKDSSAELLVAALRDAARRH